METQTLHPKDSQTHLSHQNPLYETSRDLRCILTQSCNYACGFCHKERMVGNEKSLLDAQDYAFIYETVKDTVPINGVTLSGGEPLMRKDILDITKKLKEKDAHITIVSNGALLKRKEEILDHVDRMNISLHSTNQEIYETITNTKIPIQKIMQELALMKHKYPKVDFRVNATLVQNLQPEKEIQKMIEYIIENDLTLKYIELTPITAPGHMPIKSIIPLLLQRGFTQAKDEKRQMVFQRNNAKVMLRKCTCELVSELGEQQSYCKENSDINISPDGKISSCLIDTKKVGTYELIRHRDKEGLATKFRDVTGKNMKYACCLEQS